MRKIQAKDLLNIVTFICHGEVYIFQEDLDDFLALGQELELKGLTGSEPPPEEEEQIEAKTTQFMKNTQSFVAPPLLQDNKKAVTYKFEEFEEISSDSKKN